MRKPVLCGMCGIRAVLCGIVCGINPLIFLTVRHVRHRPYVRARAHTPARAGARTRTHAGIPHMTHMAHWRGLRAAHDAAHVPAQSRARALIPLLRRPKGWEVVA